MSTNFDIDSLITKAFGGSLYGINASLVSIEVSIIQGTNLFMVGLPDNAIKESQHRIESVIKNINCKMPRQRVIVNLAPASIKKEGASYDLPIALAILNASGQFVFQDIVRYLIMGELSLDGFLRPIKGALSLAMEAKKMGLKGFILPKENALEASVVKGFDVIPVDHILEAIDFLSNKKTIKPVCYENNSKSIDISAAINEIDFADVQGQAKIKSALEVAAAGGHNIIMIGPPGAGKTMLAKRITTILPPMTLEEALETTKIFSVLGRLNNQQSLITKRPFRSPHHTISDVALVGGGSIPKPGELSLSHNGVLFLDELPEFKRTVLEVMRQPIEDKQVIISRSQMSVNFPTNFILVASMNPCPCGFYNHPEKKCICGPGVVQKYLNKISGPLLDRIDIHLEVTPVSFDQMTQNLKVETSKDIRKRVIQAREVQKRRFKNMDNIHSNSMMPAQLVKKICVIDPQSKELLKNAMNSLQLSARAYDRILKLSRTIADLDNSEKITIQHISKALRYRNLDREGWWGQ